jgi:hypothetical protein
MKMKLLKSIGLASLLAIVPGLRADIIYNNSTTDTGNRLMFTNSQQIGDQIILANTSARFATNFSFEYYSPNTSAFFGTVQADVTFYLNNGTLFNGYARPGTSFFDSGFFNISSPYSVYATTTNVATLNFDLRNNFPGGMLLPTNFTFAVTFQGLVAPDQVGVALFNPVTVGQNYPDYWLNTSTGWQLLTNSVPVNFAARFDGTVPEPSVIGLSLLGGIAALATARRRRGRN